SFVPFVETVDNVDYFILEDDPDAKFCDEFKEVFGNEEFFVIAFEKPDIFTSENVRVIQNITEELKNLEEVEEVTSLPNVDDTVSGKGCFRQGTAYRIPFTHPLYRLRGIDTQQLCPDDQFRHFERHHYDNRFDRGSRSASFYCVVKVYRQGRQGGILWGIPSTCCVVFYLHDRANAAPKTR
ncbi:MAG: hypothetical protein KAU38_05195, partial [Desulfobacterales bacterium]|nr:hypothetical protein [Desulfobacterales bacterium]